MQEDEQYKVISHREKRNDKRILSQGKIEDVMNHARTDSVPETYTSGLPKQPLTTTHCKLREDRETPTLDTAETYKDHLQMQDFHSNTHDMHANLGSNGSEQLMRNFA